MTHINADHLAIVSILMSQPHVLMHVRPGFTSECDPEVTLGLEIHDVSKVAAASHLRDLADSDASTLSWARVHSADVELHFYNVGFRLIRASENTGRLMVLVRLAGIEDYENHRYYLVHAGFAKWDSWDLVISESEDSHRRRLNGENIVSRGGAWVWA